jgi:hypothetical protein
VPYAVAIAFVRVPAEQNPNLRARRAGDPLEDYYRAMAVAFASVRRWNPEMPLMLVTNEEPGGRFADELAKLDATIQLCSFEHRPPPGFSDQFAGSLFMLDAVRACADQDTVFIDPDVVCLRDLGPVIAEMGGAVGAMPLNYPGTTAIGGLTLDQAAGLHSLLGEPLDGPVIHYGGESYIIPAAHAGAVSARAEAAWSFSLDRHRENLSRFPTEEHILSYALRGVPTCSLRPHVRRIWTAATYRTIHGDESDVSIWHLPSEKSCGFRTLHRPATDPSSWFWTSPPDEFLERVGRIMGVTSRTPGRWTRDHLGVGLSRLKRNQSVGRLAQAMRRRPA